MHVTSPAYPLAPGAAYKPSLHDLKHAMIFEKSINISNVVLVQPSIYGNDNSCLLDALKDLGARHGRGIVGIDPTTIARATLEQWHKLGVRGARLNFKSTGTRFTQASLKQILNDYARVLKPLDWTLELFVGMKDISMLEPLVADLGVKVCIAHFGAPFLPPSGEIVDPYSLQGFESLVNLLRKGNIWVKFSGAYRYDSDPTMSVISVLAEELLKVAGDRVVFASDWPHTRFESVDVKPFVELCLGMVEKRGLIEKVFRDNARELWDGA